MFESVITSLVNRYLSEYLDGLSSSDLSIHLLRGELRFENLTLKGAEINKKLLLPVEIVFGHIGLLHITWDWLALRSKPITVIVSDVNILVREKLPKDIVEHGEMKLEQDVKKEVEQEAKQRLEEKEEKKSSTDDTSSSSTTNKKRASSRQDKLDKLNAIEELRLSGEVEKDSSFLSKLLSGILSNLRILVRNVHVRYEHSREQANPISVGFVLEELRMSPTNAQGEKQHSVPVGTTDTQNNTQVHKLIEITGLGVYVNTKTVMWPCNPETMRGIWIKKEDEMKISSEEKEEKKVSTSTPVAAHLPSPAPRSSYSFLLLLNGSLRVTLNRLLSQRNADDPLITLNAAFPLVDLNLTRAQYLSLLEVQADLTKTAELMHYIPSETEKQVKSNKDAYEASQQTPERPGTIEERERYITLYKRTLSISWEPELNEEELDELFELEENITYESLDQWRLFALEEIKREMPIDSSPIGTETPLTAASGDYDDTASVSSIDSATPMSPFSNPSLLTSRSLSKRRLKSNDTGLLASVHAGISAVKDSAANAASKVASYIPLPGMLTDKLGLTTQEERERTKVKEIEQKEREECEQALASPIPTSTPVVATPEHLEVVIEPISTPQEVVEERLPVMPKVQLTSEQRAEIRSEALRKEQSMAMFGAQLGAAAASATAATSGSATTSAPTSATTASTALLNPIRSDAVMAIAEICFDTIRIRLSSDDLPISSSIPDQSELWRLSLLKTKLTAIQRLDTLSASAEIYSISLLDMALNHTKLGCYNEILSTNHGVKDVRNNRMAVSEVTASTNTVGDSPAAADDTTTAVVDIPADIHATDVLQSSLQAYSPFLRVSFQKLGASQKHALEIDAECTHLQVYLLPSLLQIPKFFEKPEWMMVEDKRKEMMKKQEEEEKEMKLEEEEALDLVSEEKKDNNGGRMADTLLLARNNEAMDVASRMTAAGATTSAASASKSSSSSTGGLLPKLPPMPITLRFRMSTPVLLFSIEPFCSSVSHEETRGLVMSWGLDVNVKIDEGLEKKLEAVVALNAFSVIESRFMTLQRDDEYLLNYSYLPEPQSKPIISPVNLRLAVEVDQESNMWNVKESNIIATQLGSFEAEATSLRTQAGAASSSTNTDAPAPPSASQNITLNCAISRLDINIGFRMYEMMMIALESYMPEKAKELMSDEKKDGSDGEKKHHKSASSSSLTEEEDPNTKVRTSIEDLLHESTLAASIASGDLSEEDKKSLAKASSIPQDPLSPLIEAQATASSLTKQLNFHEINGVFSVSGIYLNILNDTWSTGLSFTRVSVADISAHIHRFSDSGGVSCNFTLSADFYNHRVLAWEPILEQAKCIVNVHQCQLTHTPAMNLLMQSEKENGTKEKSEQSKHAHHKTLSPITSVEFRSETALNLNLSAALLEDCIDTMNVVKRRMKAMKNKAQGGLSVATAVVSSSATSSSSSTSTSRLIDTWKTIPHSSHYRLENHTDLAIQLYRIDLSQYILPSGVEEEEEEKDAAAGTDVTAIKEFMNILPFSNASFDFHSSTSIPSRALRMRLISSSGLYRSIIVPLVREMSTKHTLRYHARDADSLSLMIDIGWSSGVRTVTVHSPYGVVNKLSVPIVVSGDRYVEKELQPGQQMWLPLLTAPIMHTIRVKPMMEAGTNATTAGAASLTSASSQPSLYDWSDEIVLTTTQKSSQIKRKDAKNSPAMLEYYECRSSREPREILKSTNGSAPSSRRASLVVAVEEKKVNFTQELKEDDWKENSSQYLSTTTAILPHSASFSSTTQPPFHFTIFSSGLDTLHTNSEMKDGIDIPHTREFYSSLFEIHTPVVVENVLACDCLVRVYQSEKVHDDKQKKKDDKQSSTSNARLVQQFALQRGASLPLFSASTNHDISISVFLPSLQADWSPLSRLSFSGNDLATVSTFIRGQNGGELPISFELKQEHGELHCAVFTQYWMWDLSSLGLQVTRDKKLVLPSRRTEDQSQVYDGSKSDDSSSLIHKNPSAHLESVSLPDKHTAIMFGFPDDEKSTSLFSSKKKHEIFVRAGRHATSNAYSLNGPCADSRNPSIQWSEWSSSQNLNLSTSHQSTVTMSMGPAKSAGNYEIVMDIQAGEGKYHRTKMIKFLPRFLLVNLLKEKIQIKQYVKPHENQHQQHTTTVSSGAEFLTLDSTQQIIWHWPQHCEKDRAWICVRRCMEKETIVPKYRPEFTAPHNLPSATSKTSTEEWHWSGYFSLTTPGTQTILVRHSTQPDNYYYLSIDIRQRNGMSFILLNQLEHKTPEQQLRLKMLLPYCIANRSRTERIRVRQWCDEKNGREISSHLGRASMNNTLNTTPTNQQLLSQLQKEKEERKLNSHYDNERKVDSSSLRVPLLSQQYGASTMLQPASSSSSSLTTDDGFSWIELGPQSELPFCFEEPQIKPHAVQIQVARYDGDRIVEWIDGGKKEKLLKLQLEDFDDTHEYIDYTHVSRTPHTIALYRTFLSQSAYQRKLAHPNSTRLYYYKEQDGTNSTATKSASSASAGGLCKYFVVNDEPSNAWKREYLREKKREREREWEKQRKNAEHQTFGERLTGRHHRKTLRQARESGYDAEDSTVYSSRSNSFSRSSISETDKEHALTLGDKQNGRAAGADTEDALGVHTDEQQVHETGQAAVDEQMLSVGHGVIVEPTTNNNSSASSSSSASSALMPTSSMYLPSGAAPSGLSFGNQPSSATLTPSTIREHIRSLRVRIMSVKGLRSKDKNVFVRVLYGTQARETDARKRKGGMNQSQESMIEWQQEVIFDGKEMGQQQQTQAMNDEKQCATPTSATPPPPLRARVPRVHTVFTPTVFDPHQKQRQQQQRASTMQSQPKSPAVSCSCFPSSSSPHDCQHLFVDLFERHAVLSNTLIGSASISLSSITDTPTPHWYQLRKIKSQHSEIRGVIQLAIWFDLKEAQPAGRPLSAGLLRALPARRADGTLPRDVNGDASLKDLAVQLAVAPSASSSSSSPEEPRGKLALTGHAPPPDQRSNVTLEYANASVYASALDKLPPVNQAQPPAPKFENVKIGGVEAEVLDGQSLTEAAISEQQEVESLAMRMMESDATKECSWSEYTIRMADVIGLDRVASSLMLDSSHGRMVAYLTSPFLRRGYSILLSTSQNRSVLKEWKNQDIVFTVPDQLAAERKHHALVRISVYLYPDAAEGSVEKTASSSLTRPIGSLSSDITSSRRPLLLGTCIVPLLSIYTVKLESVLQHSEADPHAHGGKEKEQSTVDVTSSRDDVPSSHTRSSAALSASNNATAREWTMKRFSLGTPHGSTELAEVFLNIRRKEVKMPLAQAVSQVDTQSSYTPARLRFKLLLPLIGISFIDGEPEEVAYASFQNLSVTLLDSLETTSIHASLEAIQIDNLLSDAIFPVILHSSHNTSQAKSKRNRVGRHAKISQPVFQFALVRQKLASSINIQYFPYISLLLQSLDIKLSELYIYKLLDFMKDMKKRVEVEEEKDNQAEKNSNGNNATSSHTEDDKLISRKMSDEFLLPSAQLRSIYTKFLHLQPISVNITFAANPGIRNKFLGESFYDESGVLGQAIRTVLTILGAGIGSLDSAPIHLNGKIIEHHLGSPDSFKDILQSHYVKEFVKQIYSVIGSLEILGNPINTVQEFSEGMKDFFYEPTQGLMVSPEAFGEGLTDGSLSLIKHSVSGLGNAVAGVFSSGGKAIAAASLDNDFITRTSINNSKEPEHVGEGLRLGTKSLVTGITEGVTGLVTQPVQGAKEEGTKGLLKGLGKGILGIFTKPVAGALNAVSQTSRGIANTGEYIEDGPQHTLTHFRPKRFIDPRDGRIDVYNKEESEQANEQQRIEYGDVKKRALKKELEQEENNTEKNTTDNKYESDTRIH